jgi:hypothetical protein
VTQVAGAALVIAGAASITAAGQSVTLSSQANDFSGTLTVSGAAVTVSDANALNVALQAAAPSSVTARGRLQIGGAVAAPAQSSTGSTGTAGASLPLLAVNAAGVVLDTLAVQGALTVRSTDSVSQQASGALQVQGNTLIDAVGRSVTLDASSNSFAGRVTLNAGSGTVLSKGALDLSVAVAGSTRMQTDGLLTVAGTASGSSNTMTLGGAGVRFGALTVSGNLTVTSTGSVTQTGPLKVDKVFTLDAPAEGVELKNPGNKFTGPERPAPISDASGVVHPIEAGSGIEPDVLLAADVEGEIPVAAAVSGAIALASARFMRVRASRRDRRDPAASLFTLSAHRGVADCIDLAQEVGETDALAPSLVLIEREGDGLGSLRGDGTVVLVDPVLRASEAVTACGNSMVFVSGRLTLSGSDHAVLGHCLAGRPARGEASLANLQPPCRLASVAAGSDVAKLLAAAGAESRARGTLSVPSSTPLSVAIAQEQPALQGGAVSATPSPAGRLDLRPAQAFSSENCADASVADRVDPNLSKTPPEQASSGIRGWLKSAKLGIANRFKRFAGGSRLAADIRDGVDNRKR